MKFDSMSNFNYFGDNPYLERKKKIRSGYVYKKYPDLKKLIFKQLA